MKEQNKVQWIYSSKDNRELIERYDEWAKDYDKDLEEDFDYKSPALAVTFVEKYAPLEALILDAGAGTGLVGVTLAATGYKDIIAMDISQGMLDEARKKNVYKEFHQMVMGETLGFKTACFDAVVSVGVLTLGHAPASSLDELVRITKPGGYIIYTLRPDIYENNGFREKHSELEKAGLWEYIEASEPVQTLPKGEPDVLMQVWIYKVLK